MFNGYKITLTGDLGSGKSTVANILIDKYGFGYYSTGMCMRKMAADRGMSVLELNQYAETHPEVDKEIDGDLVETGKKPGDMIFDSRMAWHFVEHSFKVYLKCDPEIAAKRVCGDNKRGNVENYESIEDAIKNIANRRQSEAARYKEKYGVDIMDMNNYDAVIDASGTPEENAQKIYDAMKEYYKNNE